MGSFQELDKSRTIADSRTCDLEMEASELILRLTALGEDLDDFIAFHPVSCAPVSFIVVAERMISMTPSPLRSGTDGLTIVVGVVILVNPCWKRAFRLLRRPF